MPDPFVLRTNGFSNATSDKLLHIGLLFTETVTNSFCSKNTYHQNQTNPNKKSLAMITVS